MAGATVKFVDSQFQEGEPDLNGYGEESIADSYERAKEFIKSLADGERFGGDVYEGYTGDCVICVTHAFFLKRVEILSGSLLFGQQQIQYCSITSVRFEKKIKSRSELGYYLTEAGYKKTIEFQNMKDSVKSIEWGLEDYDMFLGMKYFSEHIFGPKQRSRSNSPGLKVESSKQMKNIDGPNKKNRRVITNWKPKL
jgi:hypothetical protein